MRNATRIILRWSFIGAFLLAAPVVILATAGYRFNPGKGRLERAGVIIVDSSPRGARVFLNDRQLKPVTPTKAVRCFPGNYRLRLEKDGYRRWEKDVVVEEGQTTFVSDATLFRDGLPEFERVLSTPDVSFSPDGRIVAAVAEVSGVVELKVIDLKTGEERTPWRAPADAQAFRLSWSIDGRRLLLERADKPTPGFIVWDAAAPKTAIALDDFTPRPFTQAFWGDDGALYAADRLNLYAIDYLTSSISEVGPAAAAMSVIGPMAYGLVKEDDGYTIVSRAVNAGTFEKLASLPVGNYRPLAAGGGRPGFVGGGRIYLIGQTASVTELRGEGASWSADGRKLAHWDGLELRLYDLDGNVDDVLARIGGAVVRASWHDRGLILFAGGGSFTVIESGHPEARAMTSLAALDSISDFAVGADGRIWLAGKLGHREGLFSLKLK